MSVLPFSEVSYLFTAIRKSGAFEDMRPIIDRFLEEGDDIGAALATWVYRTRRWRTVVTTAEEMLEAIDSFGMCKSLRTIRLTTVPENSRAYQNIGNTCIMYFSGVRRQIVIPNYRPAMTTVERSATAIAYRLGRVVGHYFTPLGITVAL